MFPTIPPAQPYPFIQGYLLVREEQGRPLHPSPERQTIVTELEKIWQTLTPSEKNTDVFAEDNDLQYQPVPIKYSHTIEVIRNFVGEIPPQEYSWDDDD
jgi:hypothetical protein